MTTDLLPTPCATRPADRKNQASRVGDDLLRHHGKRRFYTVEQVRAANGRCHIGLDVACWSHALFNSHEDFDRLHAAAAGACDYLAMKKAMLESVSSGDAADWFDFDLSWLEFPDIEWSIFDFFD